MGATETRPGANVLNHGAPETADPLPPESLNRRVVIEGIRPAVDAGVGGFAIKRTVGESVDVTANVFADGHDVIAAVLLWRPRFGAVRTSASEDTASEHRTLNPEPRTRNPEPRTPNPALGTRHPEPGIPEPGTPSPDPRAPSPDPLSAWHETPMRPLGNDEWAASFTVTELGEYEYTVEGWIDRFATWRAHLEAKWAAAQEVESELLEGAELIRATARMTSDVVVETSGRTARLTSFSDILADQDMEAAHRVSVAVDRALAELMAARPDRSRATRADPPLRVIVDRERARFGAWYEMFPRSATSDPSRSGTFTEAEALLPAIADMGFDIVYLPPIHPIGRTFRKGRNNTLGAQPGDPGSPWAIGGAEGGHTAVEPGLGTLDDFGRFVRTAERLGLEVALDLAFQTSPDHPYVTEHPEWFRHRPDGTIKYAENPPKKYQDIYPFDFEGAGWRNLWREMVAITRFWIDRGVRIFRVDNPHTKTLRFWRWMIDEIRSEHPDVIFLSEAFTRPKIMRYLAKAGFNQSYTYFTWRTTKTELTEYFTELTATEVAEYLRPNLFANTPDILHAYLQQGGRPAFKTRLILAATLGASYGIYSGFELCENVPVAPGSEEYLDSEKYQFRPRLWDQPGHIRELVARVNRIRHDNPALHHDRSLRFCNTDNPELICYSKSSLDRTNTLFVVVNLDPQHMQHGWVRIPIRDFGLGPEELYGVRDLLDDTEYLWRGEWNYVRLEPEVMPAHVLRLEPLNLESGIRNAEFQIPNSDVRTENS